MKCDQQRQLITTLQRTTRVEEYSYSSTGLVNQVLWIPFNPQRFYLRLYSENPAMGSWYIKFKSGLFMHLYSNAGDNTVVLTAALDYILPSSEIWVDDINLGVTYRALAYIKD